jgi:hypothetical protein
LGCAIAFAVPLAAVHIAKLIKKATYFAKFLAISLQSVHEGINTPFLPTSEFQIALVSKRW